MIIELTLRNTIKVTKNKKKTQRIVKRVMTCETLDITAVAEVLDSRGNHKKNICEIHLKDIGLLIVNHPYKYIKNLIAPQTKPIGYKCFTP